METEAQLRRIHNKVQQLLKQHAVLQKENNWLKTELDAAKKELTGRQEMMSNLKQQVDILKYSGGEMSEADKKEFEKRINFYVKEIDRCIIMLSQ